MPGVACVTGATGFLASELVAQLLSRDYSVRATVRPLSNTAKVACLRNLPGAFSALTLHGYGTLLDGRLGSGPAVMVAGYSSMEGCIDGSESMVTLANTTVNCADAHLRPEGVLYAELRTRRGDCECGCQSKGRRRGHDGG